MLFFSPIPAWQCSACWHKTKGAEKNRPKRCGNRKCHKPANYLPNTKPKRGRPKSIRRATLCQHKQVKHYAKGLCEPCYHERYTQTPAARKKRKARLESLRLADSA